MKYTEIDQNRIIILQKNCNPGALHQTDTRQTEIHTFFIWYPRVGREHNSPSGKKRLDDNHAKPNSPNNKNQFTFQNGRTHKNQKNLPLRGLTAT